MFLIRSLERGGAERQLVALAGALHARGHEVIVSVFYPDGAFEAPLHAKGVAIRSLDKGGRWKIPTFLLRWVQLVVTERPDILHGYLPTANVLVALARLLPGGPRVVWGVRASDMDLSAYDYLSRISYFFERSVAFMPHVVIANSEAARRHYAALGVSAERIAVIPNGIDTARFRPDAKARREIRQELGLEADVPLVGLVGRLDPMKDHPTFLAAVARMADLRPDVRFLCVGDGPAAYAETLEARTREMGLSDRLKWLPARDDIPALYAALDLAVSSSAFGEGFSNVVAEAMATGVPCAATDVGDARLLIDDTGRVVPPRDPAALADAVLAMLALSPQEKTALGQRARQRVADAFGVSALADRTLTVLESALGWA